MPTLRRLDQGEINQEQELCRAVLRRLDETIEEITREMAVEGIPLDEVEATISLAIANYPNRVNQQIVHHRVKAAYQAAVRKR